MSTVKMYCYIVMSEPCDPNHDTTVHCVCLSEQMAKQVCEKMNMRDGFNNYEYYEAELQKWSYAKNVH